MGATTIGRQLKVSKAQAVRVVKTDLDYSDAEIDEMLDFFVRVVERAMSSPRVFKLISLAKSVRP